VLEPVVERRLVGDVRAEVERLGVDDWLVLPNAFVAAALPAKLPLCRVAVVVGATRKAAEKRGMRVDLESPDGTGAAVWPALWAHIGKARRVCFPRSSRVEVPVAPARVVLSAPVLYDMTARAFDRFVARTVQAVTVTSRAAAEALAGVAGLPPCASIGPDVSVTLRRHGVEAWVEPIEPTFEALAGAIAEKLGSS